MTDYDHFFKETLPRALKALMPETKPQWGTMNAEEMIHHLRLGIKMSLENQAGTISTPEEKLPSYKRFLMSDRPFAKNLNRPKFFDHPAETNDLDRLKEGLVDDLERLLQYFSTHPEHTSVHDSFGVLNATEWTHLHYKHFRHHFIQFGLIDE
jgi:oxepin-CoA hydrolase/3-oxo-5,6-dehydrosuberyl-CoA semialdehyde dehydrogenase